MAVLALNRNHCKSLNSSSFSQPFGDRDDKTMVFWFLATGGDGKLSFRFPTSPPFNWTDAKIRGLTYFLNNGQRPSIYHSKSDPPLATAADNHSRCDRRPLNRQSGSMSWVANPRMNVVVPEGA
jgi:hypothetical protein